jgi:hypothetical protein
MSADLDNGQSDRVDGPPKTWAIETETADDGGQHLASVENEHGDVAAVVYVRDDADLSHLRAALHDVEAEMRHLTRDNGGDGR